MLVLILYGSMSAIAFFAYAIDTRRVRMGAWRIREQTLQGIALVEGWPRAWAGNVRTTHKPREPAFCGVLTLITTLHISSPCGFYENNQTLSP